MLKIINKNNVVKQKKVAIGCCALFLLGCFIVFPLLADDSTKKIRPIESSKKLISTDISGKAPLEAWFKDDKILKISVDTEVSKQEDSGFKTISTTVNVAGGINKPVSIFCCVFIKSKKGDILSCGSVGSILNKDRQKAYALSVDCQVPVYLVDDVGEIKISIYERSLGE